MRSAHQFLERQAYSGIPPIPVRISRLFPHDIATHRRVGRIEMPGSRRHRKKRELRIALQEGTSAECHCQDRQWIGNSLKKNGSDLPAPVIDTGITRTSAWPASTTLPPIAAR